MRKALSFLLCLCLIAGALTCLCGLTVFAEADYSTPVREPVTVTFDSATEYKNPYKDVKVDAAFTHEDGTTITLPCFWWGDQTFAFRFSPTKTGLWTYKVTSNDAANTSLNVTGTIQATDPKGDTNTSKHGFIAIPAGARNFT